MWRAGELSRRVFFLFLFRCFENTNLPLFAAFFFDQLPLSPFLLPMQSAVLRSSAPCAALSSSRRSASTGRVWAAAPASRRVVASRRGAVSCRAHCGVREVFFLRRGGEEEEKKTSRALIDLESNPQRWESQRERIWIGYRHLSIVDVAMHALVLKGGLETRN